MSRALAAPSRGRRLEKLANSSSIEAHARRELARENGPEAPSRDVIDKKKFAEGQSISQAHRDVTGALMKRSPLVSLIHAKLRPAGVEGAADPMFTHQRV